MSRVQPLLSALWGARVGLVARVLFVVGAYHLTRHLRSLLAWSGEDWQPVRWLVTVLVVACGLGAVAAVRRADNPASGLSLRARLVLDAIAVTGLLAASWALQARWVAVANPHDVMIGADHVSYMENAVAWRFSQWNAYNGDKYALHAMATAWASRYAGDVVRGAVWVSTASITLLPVAAWGMARPLFGAWPALLVGVVVMGDAETWISSPETTSYALQALLVTASLTAWVWYLRLPRVPTALVVGGVAALACACSEKVAFTLAPPFGLGVLWLLIEGPAPRRTPGRRLIEGVLLPIVVAGMALYGAHRLAPPVPYKSLGAQLVMQRQQQHTIQPPAPGNPGHPDPARPWPGVERMPAWLRSTELDGFLSVLLTPPDQNVLLMGQRGYEAVPNTTIPPKAWLWKHNLGEFLRARRLTGTRVLLFALGALGCLWDRRSRPGALLVSTALIAIGPLSLMYQTRYDLQLLPVVWVVTTGGLLGWGRAVAGASRVGRVISGLGVTAFVLCLGATAWSANVAPWSPGALRFPPRGALLASGVDTDIEYVGASARTLADWVIENRGTTPILDCSAHPVTVYLPNPTSVRSAARVAACRKDQIAQIPAGTWVVASNTREGGSPDLVSPEALLAAGFLLVAQGAPDGLHTDGSTIQVPAVQGEPASPEPPAGPGGAVGPPQGSGAAEPASPERPGGPAQRAIGVVLLRRP